MSFVVVLLAERTVQNRVANRHIPATEAETAREQCNALVDAIEQYYSDFPNSPEVANSSQWVNTLGGDNVKAIRYVKPEHFKHDNLGRLIDPCGLPYIIESKRSASDFKPVYPEDQQAGEFHVRSVGCGEFAIGNRAVPRRPRFK